MVLIAFILESKPRDRKIIKFVFNHSLLGKKSLSRWSYDQDKISKAGQWWWLSWSSGCFEQPEVPSSHPIIDINDQYSTNYYLENTNIKGKEFSNGPSIN